MKIGTRVTWKSQSQAFIKKKVGVIIAVVPAGKSPHDYIPQGYRCNSSDGFGLSRNHESYLVKVDGKGKRLYWPRVSYLKLTEL